MNESDDKLKQMTDDMNVKHEDDEKIFSSSTFEKDEELVLVQSGWQTVTQEKKTTKHSVFLCH